MYMYMYVYAPSFHKGFSHGNDNSSAKGIYVRPTENQLSLITHSSFVPGRGTQLSDRRGKFFHKQKDRLST